MIVFCITEEANGWKEENKKSIDNSINLLIFKPNKWCISLNLHLRLHWFRRKTFSPNSIFHIFRCLVQLKMLVKPKKKILFDQENYLHGHRHNTHPPTSPNPPTHPVATTYFSATLSQIQTYQPPIQQPTTKKPMPLPLQCF